ncbi:fatty acid desaturase [Anthocerotibacter panamensis]|uniref:fatty acid desaturase n=1 Tax=Anthocerotibacter panamensis TaxID=2857077 RepID=UPI001C4048C8|nr:fatty acid desaturase [Anthocerotibacter panamensis]
MVNLLTGADIRSRNRELLQRLEKISYQEILSTIPRECFEKNTLRGMLAVLLHLGILATSYTLWTYAPVWLAPLFWVWVGTVLWGNFVLAHDCGHRSFSPFNGLNDCIGHTLLLPTLYPFHSWRIMHNRHHTWTNHQEKDNSWRTITPEKYLAMSVFDRFWYRNAHSYAWWFASEIHLFLYHYDKAKFRPQEWSEARFSIAMVLGFGAIFFPALVYYTGFWGLVNYWLMPWLVFHFWLSTFTMIHHNHPDVPYYHPEDWTPVKAQLFGTVDCSYPWWVELVAYNIGIHVPHHLTTAIPYYNLPKAQAALKTRWPDFIHEARFRWSYVQKIVSTCHLCDREGYHVPVSTIAHQHVKS